jgi:hypothetical protein
MVQTVRATGERLGLAELESVGGEPDAQSCTSAGGDGVYFGPGTVRAWV